jgi:hypothetical protein
VSDGTVTKEGQWTTVQRAIDDGQAFTAESFHELPDELRAAINWLEANPDKYVLQYLSLDAARGLLEAVDNKPFAGLDEIKERQSDRRENAPHCVLVGDCSPGKHYDEMLDGQELLDIDALIAAAERLRDALFTAYGRLSVYQAHFYPAGCGGVETMRSVQFSPADHDGLIAELGKALGVIE